MIRREVYTILVALAVAAVAGALLTLVVGQSPLEVYSRLIVRTKLSRSALRRDTAVTETPLPGLP